MTFSVFSPERWGAFVEYVVRPTTEDIRIILEKLKELQLPISDQLIRNVVSVTVKTHVALEFLRSLTYIIITWLVCKTVIRVL